jgi:hypothetical protein
MADLQLWFSLPHTNARDAPLGVRKVVLPARRVRPPGRETEHPNLQKPSLLA